jgi:hypothetical protein
MQEQVYSIDYLKEDNKMVINFNDEIKKIFVITDFSFAKTKILCELKVPIVALRSKAWDYNKFTYNYIVEKLLYKKSELDFRNTHDETLKFTHYCFKEETLYIYVKEEDLIKGDKFIGFDFWHELPDKMRSNLDKTRKRHKIYVHKDNFFYIEDINLNKINPETYDYSNAERNKLLLRKLLKEREHKHTPSTPNTL